MSPRPRLLLLIPHLGGGGAEQVTSSLAQHLDPHLFEIHLGLLTADRPGSRQPPSWVQVHRLGASRVRNGARAVLKLIRGLRPDLVLSNMVHLNHLVLLLKPLFPRQAKVLVRQNTTASSAASARFARLRYRLLYPRADAILCQSQAMADDLADNFSLPRNKLAVLHNPLDVERIKEFATDIPFATQIPVRSPNILSVGRLAPEKGIDLLLHAFVTVRERHPAAGLLLIGAGPEERYLQDLSRQLGLQDAVHFLGHQDNPAAWYVGCSLFVLPSRHEGMPNALLEAAAGGLPIVATPCNAGLIGLLSGQPAAWLARDVSAPALADSILAALAELNSSEGRPPQRFEHGFVAPFAIQTAIPAYERLLLQVASGSLPVNGEM